MKERLGAALVLLMLTGPSHGLDLNSRGQVGAGVGGGVVSIDDLPIAQPAGGASWWDDDRLVYQVCEAGRCRLEGFDQRTGQRTELAPRGANHVAAGGGVWAAWLGGYGVYASTGLHLPDAGLAVVGPDGAIAIKVAYQSFGPWDVLERDGSRWRLAEGDAHNITLLGAGRAVWMEHQTIRTRQLPAVQALSGARWWLRGLLVDGELWVLYQSEGLGGRLVLHPAGDLRGYALTPPGANAYRPDAVPVASGVVKVAWAVREDEAPGTMQSTVVSVHRAPRVDLAALLVTSPTPTPPPAPEPAPLPTPQPRLEAPNARATVAAVRADHPDINPCDEVARAALVDWAAQRLNRAQQTDRWGRKSRGRVVDGRADRPNTDAVTYRRDDGLFEIYDALSGGGSCDAMWTGYGPFKPGENGYWAPPQLGPEPGSEPQEPRPEPDPPADLTRRLDALEAAVARLDARLAEVAGIEPRVAALEARGSGVPEERVRALIVDAFAAAVVQGRSGSAWGHAHPLHLGITLEWPR